MWSVGEVCTDCLAVWRKKKTPTLKGHKCRRCLECDGQGARIRKRGDERYDPYLGLTLAELNEEKKPGEGEERRGFVLSVANPDEDFGWAERRELKDKAGSYPALRRVLEWLREHYPGRHSLLLGWLDNPDVAKDDGVLRNVRETVLMVTEMMPETIRVPGWLRDA